MLAADAQFNVGTGLPAEAYSHLNKLADIPCLIESDMSRKAFRKNWARLIKKVYNTDPLLCPKCNGAMRIIAFIEEEAVTFKESVSTVITSCTEKYHFCSVSFQALRTSFYIAEFISVYYQIFTIVH